MALKTIVLLPTYNEKENIEDLIRAILALKIKNLEIIVIDDNSPDSTPKIVKKLKNPKVHLLLRKGKRGRGLAGIAGFKKALEKNADYIIEMDADFSHKPEYIPIMLKEIEKYDIILGSRLVRGSKDDERTPIRKLITKFANLYIRTILGLKIKDCSSGFRCFRKGVIESIIHDLNSEGPDIIQEVLYKSYLRGFKIKEIPLEFRNRKKGKSKLGVIQLIKGISIIIKLKFMHIIRRI
ncbi:MAG: polyprenol monophosphomannose synthase [Nanoarchaeota archaeon]|nr:polyprenol monophosphomannose synthase [Nanoarchaeota archaeon]